MAEFPNFVLVSRKFRISMISVSSFAAFLPKILIEDHVQAFYPGEGSIRVQVTQLRDFTFGLRIPGMTQPENFPLSTPHIYRNKAGDAGAKLYG
jgi:hypothetical protein